MAEHSNPRSIHSRIATSVRFINHSGSHVKVLWLNYQGEQVLYSTLEPSNGYYDVNTFVTHPWVAVEEGTNHQMLLNSRQIYFPSPPEVPHAVMAHVFITPNVPNSLEECCKNMLKKIVLPENICQLPLPQMFIKDISQSN